MPDGKTSSWLIKPHVLWLDWSEQAESMHGLTRDKLIEDGHEISVVAQQLNTLLPKIVYCDAWTFDSFWLYQLYRIAKIKPSFELESIAQLLDKPMAQAWQKTREEALLALGVQAHRAANDALILHKTWLQLNQP